MPRDSGLSTSLPTLGVSSFLDSGHPDGCAVVTPHSFALHFLND